MILRIKSIVIVVVVLGLVSILTAEGYYVYQFYADPQVASGATEGTTPVSADGSGTPGESVILVHRATPGNVSANSTYLDSPLTNGNPDALVSVTQNWNPGGDGGTYNDHEIGVWYDSSREKWAIFNQDRADMTEGLAFNVIVFEEPA